VLLREASPALRGLVSAHQFNGLNAGKGASASQLMPSFDVSVEFGARAMSSLRHREPPAAASHALAPARVQVTDAAKERARWITFARMHLKLLSVGVSPA
jgi:hypothetical protein